MSTTLQGVQRSSRRAGPGVESHSSRSWLDGQIEFLFRTEGLGDVPKMSEAVKRELVASGMRSKWIPATACHSCDATADHIGSDRINGLVRHVPLCKACAFSPVAAAARVRRKKAKGHSGNFIGVGQ